MNPKICDCPFTDWCHETRQWLQEEFRDLCEKENGEPYEVEDCNFYKAIKKKEL